MGEGKKSLFQDNAILQQPVLCDEKQMHASFRLILLEGRAHISISESYFKGAELSQPFFLDRVEAKQARGKKKQKQKPSHLVNAVGK